MKIPTIRIEAFSDGVIAIIITLMILEIKLPFIPPEATSGEIWNRLGEMTPHLIAYIMSFVVLGILWVNHHHFFHQVAHTDRKLPWLNLHLLFWMSLIPLPTAFIGEHYQKPEATAFYGFVMFMTAVAFALMRTYSQDKANLSLENLSKRLQMRYRLMNRIGSFLYFISIFAGYVSVYISLAIFILVPMMYFIPMKIEMEEPG